MRIILILLIFLPFPVGGLDPKIRAEKSKEYNDYTRYPKAITTEMLKSWLDQNKQVILLDARKKTMDDGWRIKGAYLLPYDSTEDEIRNAIPSKNATIVVYCASAYCPSSQLLFNRLQRLGFTNVYRYREGLKAWMNAGNPVDNIQPGYWNSRVDRTLRGREIHD